MRTRSLLAVAAFCAAVALPGIAAAQSVAYTLDNGYTNMRSGPGTQYTVIARIYPGTEVDVVGCLETRSWCDVIVQDIRGWISTTRLEFAYGGRRVLVPDYYPYFDPPIIEFRFGNDDRRHHRRDSRRDRDRDRDGHDYDGRGPDNGGRPPRNGEPVPVEPGPGWDAQPGGPNPDVVPMPDGITPLPRGEDTIPSPGGEVPNGEVTPLPRGEDSFGGCPPGDQSCLAQPQ